MSNIDSLPYVEAELNYLAPMSERDRTAKNLARHLDFSLRRPPVKLPAFDPPDPTACPAGSAF